MSFLSKVARLFSPSSSAAAIVPTGTAGASRTVARERLSVILASQRGSDLLAGVDMDRLQDDVLNVVKVRLRYFDFGGMEGTLPPPLSLSHTHAHTTFVLSLIYTHPQTQPKIK